MKDLKKSICDIQPLSSAAEKPGHYYAQPATIEKGRTTWEWKFPDGHQITFYQRPAGTLFGGHFHKGDDPSKNPERLLVLSGRFAIDFKLSKDGPWISEVIDASNGPVELIVYPNVLHRLVAEKDTWYIEYRVTHFNPSKPDTYEEDLFV